MMNLDGLAWFAGNQCGLIDNESSFLEAELISFPVFSLPSFV